MPLGLISRTGDSLFRRRRPALKRAPLLFRGRCARRIEFGGVGLTFMVSAGGEPQRFDARGSTAGLHLRCGQGGSGGGLSGCPLGASSRGRAARWSSRFRRSSLADRDLCPVTAALSGLTLVLISWWYLSIIHDAVTSSFGGVDVGACPNNSLVAFRLVASLLLHRLAILICSSNLSMAGSSIGGFCTKSSCSTLC